MNSPMSENDKDKEREILESFGKTERLSKEELESFVSKFDEESSKHHLNSYYKWSVPMERKLDCLEEPGKYGVRILNGFTHTMAIMFMAMTWVWIGWGDHEERKENEKRWSKLTVDNLERKVHAFYKVLEKKEEDVFLCVAWHANIYGEHRQDLRIVEINAFSRVTSSRGPGSEMIKDFMIGDVIKVTQLIPKHKPNSTSNIISKTKWAVFDGELLRRDLTYETCFVFLDQNANSTCSMGIAKAFPEITTIKNANRSLDRSKVYKGTAFAPIIQTEICIMNELSEGTTKNDVKALTASFFEYPPATVVLFDFEVEDKWTSFFNIGKTAFSADFSHETPRNRMEAAEMCILLGYAAAEAVNHGKRDSRTFVVEDFEVKDELSAVSFNIPNPAENPTFGSWGESTQIVVKIGWKKVDATVFSAEIVDGFLNLIAAVEWRFLNDLKTNAKGTIMVCQQDQYKQPRMQIGFLQSLLKPHDYSNGLNAIRTLYGGPKNETLPDIPIRKFYFPVQPDMALNNAQNRYVTMILAKLPVLIGSSPFGCGKSMMIVTAALEYNRSNNSGANKLSGVKQLLLTQSNLASQNLADFFAKITQGNRNGIKVVRYITESNQRRTQRQFATNFDMGSLIAEFVNRMFNLNVFDDDLDQILLHFNDNYEKDKLNDKAQKRLFEIMNRRARKSGKELTEIFFKCLAPDVLISTVDSIAQLLRTEAIDPNTVELVQIDEASVLPEHALIWLFSVFPNASFGLVGDCRQLPPYCQNLLEGQLKDFGVGSVLSKAIMEEMFPVVDLEVVYRCHPLVTKLLGGAFYSGKIISGVKGEERRKLIGRIPEIWNKRRPIVFVNNDELPKWSGKSLINEEELRIVYLLMNIIKRTPGIKMTEQVGVMSFYKAQSHQLQKNLSRQGFDGMKIGSVDSFQGAERDISIVCLTRDQANDFVADPKRINVALSRAREGTIVIGNINELRANDIWEAIVKQSAILPIDAWLGASMQ